MNRKSVKEMLCIHTIVVVIWTASKVLLYEIAEFYE